MKRFYFLAFFILITSSLSMAQTKKLLGGSTPAELGMTLITALKNNDKNTYLSCINPNLSQDSYNDNSEDFEKLRSWFEDRGLINWKDLEFSRIRCQTRLDGNVKVAAFFHIEFTYKKFLGSINLGSARSIPGGDKYLLSGGFVRSSSQFYPAGAWGR